MLSPVRARGRLSCWASICLAESAALAWHSQPEPGWFFRASVGCCSCGLLCNELYMCHMQESFLKFAFKTLLDCAANRNKDFRKRTAKCAQWPACRSRPGRSGWACPVPSGVAMLLTSQAPIHPLSRFLGTLRVGVTQQPGNMGFIQMKLVGAAASMERVHGEAHDEPHGDAVTMGPGPLVYSHELVSWCSWAWDSAVLLVSFCQWRHLKPVCPNWTVQAVCFSVSFSPTWKTQGLMHTCVCRS